uniref:Uncharacterized protein n=1 Tax=Wuchereria bancrofti TaxID=6293 RepID=A0A1I8EWQ8_WUCBA
MYMVLTGNKLVVFMKDLVHDVNGRKLYSLVTGPISLAMILFVAMELAVHIPAVPGSLRIYRRIILFVPEASTLLQRFIGWLTGKRAEFVDSTISAMADGQQGKKFIKDF